jgi:amino-acid N-acetyltransferase
MEMNIRPAEASDCNAVCALLTANHLPVDDINKALPHFFVAIAGNRITGVIGMEKYEQYGLLRSMVTDTQYRNAGTAGKLVSVLFEYAAASGIKEIYLLTETAKEYFEKKSFSVVERSLVPEAIQKSAEFSHVCPSTAVVMKKFINA